MSSLAVAGNNLTSYVEWDWVYGYDCPPDQIFQFVPTMFMARDTTNGPYVCEDTTRTLTFGTYPLLTLEDENQNTWWNGRVSGVEEHQMNIDFSLGHALTNGERENPSDSNYAEFTEIEELFSGGWNNFDDIQQYVDSDPTYIFCRTKCAP